MTLTMHTFQHTTLRQSVQQQQLLTCIKYFRQNTSTNVQHCFIHKDKKAKWFSYNIWPRNGNRREMGKQKWTIFQLSDPHEPQPMYSLFQTNEWQYPIPFCPAIHINCLIPLTSCTNWQVLRVNTENKLIQPKVHQRHAIWLYTDYSVWIQLPTHD